MATILLLGGMADGLEEEVPEGKEPSPVLKVFWMRYDLKKLADGELYYVYTGDLW